MECSGILGNPEHILTPGPDSAVEANNDLTIPAKSSPSSFKNENTGVYHYYVRRLGFFNWLVARDLPLLQTEDPHVCVVKRAKKILIVLDIEYRILCTK